MVGAYLDNTCAKLGLLKVIVADSSGRCFFVFVFAPRYPALQTTLRCMNGIRSPSTSRTSSVQIDGSMEGQTRPYEANLSATFWAMPTKRKRRRVVPKSMWHACCCIFCGVIASGGLGGSAYGCCMQAQEGEKAANKNYT